MREIPLGKGAIKHTGRVALVDDNDYAGLMKYRWYASLRNRKDKYHAIRTVAVGSKTHGTFKNNTIPMARQILEAPSDSFILHLNGNTLDCTRKNMKAVTRRQYAALQPPRPGGTSKYKGVVWVPSKNRWRAIITDLLDSRYLGSYKKEKEAARAYDAAALALFGEYAYLNFPKKR